MDQKSRGGYVITLFTRTAAQPKPLPIHGHRHDSPGITSTSIGIGTYRVKSHERSRWHIERSARKQSLVKGQLLGKSRNFDTNRVTRAPPFTDRTVLDHDHGKGVPATASRPAAGLRRCSLRLVTMSRLPQTRTIRSSLPTAAGLLRSAIAPGKAGRHRELAGSTKIQEVWIVSQPRPNAVCGDGFCKGFHDPCS